jgi:sensor histidine kinase YesM
MYFKNLKDRLWITHSCAWVVYSIFIYLTNRLTRPDIRILEVLLFLIPFCLTFYLILYCLSLNKNKTVIWGIVTFFIAFFIMSAIGYILIYWVLPVTGIILYKSTRFSHFLAGALLGYVQYFAYAMLYFYIRETFITEKKLRLLHEEKLLLEKQKVEKELENAILKQQELKAQQEKLQYEYAFLRSQINPHFLHNTLNVLFSQALDFSDELAENIQKLSTMMRYSIESVEYENGTVSVQKELEYLQVLLDIHNIRFGNTKVIKYEIDGEARDQMLPPLSIITIVENAFKYGDLKDPEYPLHIKIAFKPKEIYFCCRNKKKKNNLQLSSHNIGITNLSKRLDVSFRGRYEMKATNEENFYTFELTIKN